MQDNFCEYEAAVLAAVESGRWPQACDPELREHVSRCSICADVVLVAQIFQQESRLAREEAAPPAAGLVWWKAQLRAKREAAERAEEPIALVEKAAGIFGLVSLLALAIWRWDLVADWVGWIAGIPRSEAFHAGGLWNSAIFTATQNLGFFTILSAVSCVLLASVVLYYALSKE